MDRSQQLTSFNIQQWSNRIVHIFSPYAPQGILHSAAGLAVGLEATLSSDIFPQNGHARKSINEQKLSTPLNPDLPNANVQNRQQNHTL